jgi:hypothetical protein
VGLRLRQYPVPGAVSSPTVEPIRTGAQFPQDAIDDGAMISPLTTTAPSRKRHRRFPRPVSGDGGSGDVVWRRG